MQLTLTKSQEYCVKDIPKIGLSLNASIVHSIYLAVLQLFCGITPLQSENLNAYCRAEVIASVKGQGLFRRVDPTKLSTVKFAG